MKLFLLSTGQEKFQDMSIALDILGQETQESHALEQRISTRVINGKNGFVYKVRYEIFS